jgi:putative ABC transport system permease protein
VGVVGDVNTAESFDAPTTRLQVYGDAWSQTGIWYNLIMETTLAPEVLMKSLHNVIGGFDTDIMVEKADYVPDILKGMVAGNYLMIITLGSFAFIGLFIAMIGLYGVVSQLTNQRSREIGIRMALGADYHSVVGMILSQGAVLIAIGVVTGLVCAFFVSLVYRQTMPELRLPNAGLQAGIAAFLCIAGLLACYMPARRAGRVNPVEALHSE